MKRLMEITEGKVSEELGQFRKGKGCMNWIFVIKMMVQEYLEKDEKVNAAFMEQENAYNTVDREPL